MRKNILLLCIGFSLIFLGFSGTQQYLTILLSNGHSGTVDGFISLILIYGMYLIASPFAALIIAKLAPKKSLIFASIGYFLYILSVYEKNIALIYFFSCVVGVCAAILWTSAYVYILRLSDNTNRGANSGLFYSVGRFGAVLSVLAIGYLLSSSIGHQTILLYALFPFAGAIVLIFLQDKGGQSSAKNAMIGVQAAFRDLDNLRIASIFFSFMFIYGLLIGIIPLLIKSVLGLAYVGVLTSFIYIVPVLFSYILGKWSDIQGRKNVLYFAYASAILSLFLLYFKNPIGIAIGIIIFAVNDSLADTISAAIVGDLAKEENLESLNAFFGTIKTLGIVVSLVLSAFIQNNLVYVLSIIVLFASFIFVLPVLRKHDIFQVNEYKS